MRKLQVPWQLSREVVEAIREMAKAQGKPAQVVADEVLKIGLNNLKIKL